MLTRWERVYSVGMAKFTREEVIQVAQHGRKCVGANLRDVDLRGANLFEAYYDVSTKWPEYFDPEAAVAVLVKDDDWPAGSGCIYKGGLSYVKSAANN